MEREIVANAFHHVNWGIPVAQYYLLVGSSAGSLIVGTLGCVFRVNKYKPLSFFAANLALAQMLIVLVMLLFDLGQITRVMHLFPGVTMFPHATAPLAWGTVLVSTYPLALAVFSYLIYKRNEKWARLVGILAVLLAISTHLYTSIAMALNPSRHLNHTALAGLLFLVGAFISGIGVLNIMLRLRDVFVRTVHRTDPALIVSLGRLMLIGIALDLSLVYLEFMQKAYGTEEEAHVLDLIGTVFSVPVLYLHLAIGLVAPLAILLSPYGKKVGGVLLASLLATTGIFGMRLGWVLISQFSQTFF